MTDIQLYRERGKPWKCTLGHINHGPQPACMTCVEARRKKETTNE